MNEQPYLSILLPSYNNRCYPLVHALKQQADAIGGLRYEIIVADDGSRDQVAVISNYLINELEYCRYIRRHENVGRSRIRNFLAAEAEGEWLLFMDSDVSIVREDFLARYLSLTDKVQVIDGGVTVIGDTCAMRCNLRFWYEHEAEPLHTATRRSETPYQHVHTASLLMPRSIARSYPFDERIRRYGYEDVMFGKMLCNGGIHIIHIDNPVGLAKFESNEVFVRKTEEALRTLHDFAGELAGYSTLLDTVAMLNAKNIAWLVRLWHRLFCGIERRNLHGEKPSLRVFKLYKLGYYTSLM